MTDRPHSESSIVDNRRSHLSSEVPAAGRRIAEREHDHQDGAYGALQAAP